MIAIQIKKQNRFDAYAVIVDINGFSAMVRQCRTGTIAQDIRDSLAGAITAVEVSGGEVVAFMGDAFLAVVATTEELVKACYGIAKDVDRTCEYISNAQADNPDDWHHMPGGPSLKIAIEYGVLDVSIITSQFLGEQYLVIGTPINTASRISSFGDGNRCLLGPSAGLKLQDWLAPGLIDGPFQEGISGKELEGLYTYYAWNMGDVWREGSRREGGESYWG